MARIQRLNPFIWLGRLLAIFWAWYMSRPNMKRMNKWYRKRTPFGRQESKEWSKPSDEAVYQESLYWEGFITPDFWEDDELKNFPAIMQDLDDLEEYLLPTFWEYNQKARFYQRSYYYYQWVFIIGAFLTTILGVLTTFFTSGEGEDATVRFLFTNFNHVQLLGIDFFGVSMSGLFSASTTVVSAITSYFTLLSNQGEPRKRWASYRRLAEELRMLYFKFVSRMEPYHRPNRVEVLRKRIIEIREQEPSSG